jgi:hypothetical protein
MRFSPFCLPLRLYRDTITAESDQIKPLAESGRLMNMRQSSAVNRWRVFCLLLILILGTYANSFKAGWHLDKNRIMATVMERFPQRPETRASF